MGTRKGTERTELMVAKHRVSITKTCLRNKAAKHQREIELQIEKIKEAEAILAEVEAKLEAAESE